MSSLAGQTFAGYEILAKLGEGGMGSVFKARQPTLNRLVALKVMATQLSSDSMFVSRFRREANAAAALNHENIVQVFTAGESDGTHYIAMEFVEGKTLRQHIDSHGKLDPREAIAITVYVAKALQYAWNKAKLIHRDIKPENIFLSDAGEVKVGDLGLAKTVGGETTSLTQTGMMMGSPNYISPEQARGLSDIDFRTDIYSLGCTLYHMLTGRPPYSGSDPLVVITKHVNDPPPAIFKVWPTCPIPLALAVGRMLTKNRNDRPASYEDLIAQLQEVHDKLKPAAAAAPVTATGSAKTPAATPTPKPASATPRPSVAKTPTSVPRAKRTSWSSRISVLRTNRLKPGLQRAMLYAAAGVAAIAAIAGAVWWFAGRATTAQVDDAFILEVGALPAEQQATRVVARLKEINPQFDVAMAKHKIENDAVVELSFPSSGVTDISPVAALKRLRVLDCNGRSQAVSKLCDFSPLRGLSLTELKADWTGLEDLSPLHGMPIRTLSIQHTKVSDLSVLAGMPLNNLEMAGTPVNDIAPLANLPLVRLHLHGCKTLRDLSPLRGRKITWLCFAGTQVEDLSPLRGMPLAGVVCNNNVLRSPQNLAVLRAIPTLKGVNNGPAAKFWQQVDAGQLQATTSTPEQEQAAAQQPRQTIDLLALTDPVKDRIKVERGASHSKGNAWEWRGGALAYVSDGGSGKLAPPVAINARSYEIEVEFERLSGPGRFHVDLPLDASRIIPLNFDSKNKMINCRAGDSWPPNRGPRAQVVVRLDRSPNDEQDRITIRLDGELVVDWQGNATSVAQTGEPHPVFPGQPITSIYIHKDSYEVRSWQLRVFDGEATVLRGAAATGDAGWQNAINLLPQIDPQKDAIEGDWNLTDDRLVLERPKAVGVLRLPYVPPEEYDFEIECTPQSDGKNINMHLVAAGSSFAWKLNAYGQTPPIYGFDLLDGKLSKDRDEAVVSKPLTLKPGQRYTSRVEVRRGSLRALVDGEEYVRWSGDFNRLSLETLWKLPNNRNLALSTYNRGVIFHRIEVREVTGKGQLTRGASMADDWRNAINLLPVIDPQKDAVAGTWTFQNGELAVGNTPFARLEIPYEPPEEYDFRITFTRLAGQEGVTQILTKSGSPFAWCVGFDSNTIGAFGMINGRMGGSPDNPTRVRRDAWIENKRLYTMVVAVRNDGLKAFLNDELITQWKTDYSDMGIYSNWQLRNPKRLGVAASRSETLFHRIEVREVTGKGTLTRGAPAAASAWLPVDIAAACNADVISTESRKAANQLTFNGGTLASASWLRKKGYPQPGLPDDGRVQIPDATPAECFQIRVPPAKNAILISGPEGRFPQPATVELTAADRRRYSELVVLQATCWGNGTLRVILRYETGLETTASIPLLDWFPGGRASLPDGVRVAVTSHDTHPTGGKLAEILAHRIPADPQRVLRSLTFSISSLTPPKGHSEQDARRRFTVGIFAISALPAAPSTSTLQHSNTPATADAAWQNAINLLPLVDLSQDVNSGKWEAAPDGLKATDIKSMSQKLQPPYRPPEEYDYRVSFTPMSGNADVAIGLTARGRSFVFYMKKFANDHCLGFEAIGGKAIAAGPTAHRFPHLEMGSRYTVVVEVRKNGLRGCLDDKLVAEWATDYSDMTAWPVWKFKDDTLPGFGCSLSTVVFQEVKLREVSGKGTFTRGAAKP